MDTDEQKGDFFCLIKATLREMNAELEKFANTTRQNSACIQGYTNVNESPKFTKPGRFFQGSYNETDNKFKRINGIQSHDVISSNEENLQGKIIATCDESCAFETTPDDSYVISTASELKSCSSGLREVGMNGVGNEYKKINVNENSDAEAAFLTSMRFRLGICNMKLQLMLTQPLNEAITTRFEFGISFCTPAHWYWFWFKKIRLRN